jgi:hypothetical protein
LPGLRPGMVLFGEECGSMGHDTPIHVEPDQCRKGPVLLGI